jgi:hypothetical protein
MIRTYFKNGQKQNPKGFEHETETKCPKEDQDQKKESGKMSHRRKEEHGSKLRSTNLWKTEIDGETWSKGWRFFLLLVAWD